MSEALMSGVALQAKGGANKLSPTDTTDARDPQQAADFSMLFGDAMLQQAPNGERLPTLDPQQLQRLLTARADQGTDPRLATSPAVPAQAGKTLPPALPQLAFSALLAVDDGDQAAAMTLQGDSQSLRASQPVVSQDLSQAMRQALAKQMLQRGDAPAAMSTTQLALNNPGLEPEHFKLELNNLTQALADQLAREANVDSSQNTRSLSATANNANANSTNTGLNSLGSLSSQLGTGPRPETGAGGNVGVPPQHPQWGQQVGDRVQWMIGQNLQRADIRLNPPELGSLEVRIQVNGDQQTNISFSSPHAQVREALEAALPRLREMMNDSGLDLGNVDVSQHSFADAQTQQSGQEAGEGSGGNHLASGEAATVDGEDPSADTVVKQGTGLVDFYA